VSLPVTSALIFGLARKIGRIVLNARFNPKAKTKRTANATAVMLGLIRRRTTIAKTAVKIPRQTQ